MTDVVAKMKAKHGAEATYWLWEPMQITSGRSLDMVYEEDLCTEDALFFLCCGEGGTTEMNVIVPGATRKQALANVNKALWPQHQD